MAFKDPGFADRASTAAEARKAALEKFKARPAPQDDPKFQERQAAKTASRIAREKRAADKKAAKEAQERAQREAREAAIIAAEQARVAAIEEARLAEIRLKTDQKAARDARYAARKARRHG
jgi:hypothetical protein